MKTFDIEKYTIAASDGSPASVARKMVMYQHPKMKALSSGAFATVYGHKSIDHVYKVADNDKAYQSFVRAIQTSNNPLFPVIHGVRLLEQKIVHKTNTCCVVALERLTPIRGRLANLYDEVFEEYVIEPDNNTRRFLQEICALNGFTDSKSIDEAATLLERLVDVTGYGLDLHSDNVMLRGKQLVITDPVCQND